jgi:hypothetical protein
MTSPLRIIYEILENDAAERAIFVELLENESVVNVILANYDNVEFEIRIQEKKPGTKSPAEIEQILIEHTEMKKRLIETQELWDNNGLLSWLGSGEPICWSGERPGDDPIHKKYGGNQ